MAKLVINFRCLCFFVADEAAKQMHVVTPATCGCEHGDVEKHSSFLVFPKDGGRLNAAGNFKGDGEPGKADYVEMEGWSLILGNETRTVFDFPASLVDLNGVTNDAVNPALVRGPRDKRITSRVTLKGGSLTATMAPGFWNFVDPKNIPMARDVTWTIDGFADETLVIRRSRFAVGQQPDPAGDEEVVRLQPNRRGEFRLEFHHSRDGDFGHPLVTLDPDSAAQHFAAYYTLFDEPKNEPIPTFVTSPDVGVVGCLGARAKTA